MKKKLKLKKGDVYNFQWSTEEYEKEVYGGALRHCFEGLLVVMLDERFEKPELKLVDTFWGVNKITQEQDVFTLKEAQERGTLEYYCNLNEIEPVERYNLDEYDDKDLIKLHDQHACVESCVYWYKKKGAKKSSEKKISTLEEKLRKEKSDIEYSVRRVEQISTEIENVKNNGLK